MARSSAEPEDNERCCSRGLNSDRMSDKAAAEVFPLLWMQWQNVENPTEELTADLLQAISIGRLYGELTRYIIKSNLSDAARDIHKLLDSHWTAQLVEDVTPAEVKHILVALDGATKSFIACETHRWNASGDSFDITAFNAKSMSWSDFERIPSEVQDVPIVYSVNGRVLVDSVNEVANQQQWLLTQCQLGTCHESKGRSIMLDARFKIQSRLACVDKVDVLLTKNDNVKARDQVRQCDSNDELIAYISNHNASIGAIEERIEASHGEMNHRALRKSVVDVLIDNCSNNQVMPTPDVGILAELEHYIASIPTVNATAAYVSSLLGIQLRIYSVFLDLCDSGASLDRERRVRKLFNSLTDNDEHSSQLLSLLQLIAIDTSVVLDQILKNALRSTQNHHLFMRLFQICPLLLSWAIVRRLENKNSIGTSNHDIRRSYLMASLKDVVAEYINRDLQVEPTGTYHVDEEALVNFLNGLSSMEPASDIQVASATGATFVDDILRDIFGCVILLQCSDLDRHYRSVKLLRNYLCPILAHTHHSLSQEMEGILTAVVNVYIRVGGMHSTVKIRGVILEIVYAFTVAFPDWDIAKVQASKAWFDQGDIALVTLLHRWRLSHGSSSTLESNEQSANNILRHEYEQFRLCTSRDMNVDIFGKGTITNCKMMYGAIQWSIWTAAWNTPDRQKVATEAVYTRHGDILRWFIDRHIQFGGDMTAIAGDLIVQNVVSTIFFSTTSDSFERVASVIKTILQEKLHGCQEQGTLTLPLAISQGETSQLQFTLSPALVVMRYFFRCWVLSLANRNASCSSIDRGVDTAYLSDMLEQLLPLVGETIEESIQDMCSLLYCLQTLCLVKSMSTDKSIQLSASVFNRLEIAVVRVLFLLQQIGGESSMKAQFGQSYTAVLLAQSDFVSCDQVRRFLRVAAI